MKKRHVALLLVLLLGLIGAIVLGIQRTAESEARYDLAVHLIRTEVDETAHSKFSEFDRGGGCERLAGDIWDAVGWVNCVNPNNGATLQARWEVIFAETHKKILYMSVGMVTLGDRDNAMRQVAKIKAQE